MKAGNIRRSWLVESYALVRRASVATSMLNVAGRKIVAIDDSFDGAEKVGLHMVGSEAA